MSQTKSLMSVLAVCAAALFAPSSASAAVECNIPANAGQIVNLVGEGINQQRRASGLRALRPHESLQQAAFAHACDMAQMGRMTHTGSNGSDVQQRARLYGLSTCTIAENTAWGRPYEQPVNLVAAWMNSAGHRYNILLDRGVTYYGMGVAYSGTTPYFSWVVARPC